MFGISFGDITNTIIYEIKHDTRDRSRSTDRRLGACSNNRIIQVYTNNKGIMKTQEEIEQLADKYSALGKGAGLTYREEKLENIAYRRGYEQCQEDMAKDLQMHVLLNEHDWSRNPQAQLNDFINSLSKED